MDSREAAAEMRIRIAEDRLYEHEIACPQCDAGGACFSFDYLEERALASYFEVQE